MDPSELNIPGLRPPAPPSGDENVRGILRFGFWMIVAAVVIYAVLWGMFNYFDRQAAAADPAQNPLLAGEKRPVSPVARFPQPQLQSNAAAELEKARAREDERLSSYGWVDREAGVVHMPIERAVQMVAERGVPVWPGAPPPAQITEKKK